MTKVSTIILPTTAPMEIPEKQCESIWKSLRGCAWCWICTGMRWKRKALHQLLEEHPGIRLVLDLHRDASGGEEGQMRTRAEVAGETSAQLMVVIGTNHENYEENLSLGLKLHALLEQRAPGIMRPLQLRGQRFNQDLNSGALLIEIGAAGNSHGEARLAAEQLAEAIVCLAKGTK